MYVLDTNIVSELRKVRSGKANSGVARWAEQVPSVALFISVITIQELEHGVLLVERSDPTQGAVLRAWLDQSVRAAFKDRVIAVDEMTVVTRDLEDFERFDDLDVLDPRN
jgi:predicted nucleic acid-binding protein